MKTFKTISKVTKTAFLSALLAVTMVTFNTDSANAQVEVSPGVDIVSTYVFRGVAYSGPSFQPYVELASGSFAVGAWGSQDFAGTFQEMDLYAGYSFDFGLYLGLTDYYYPGTSFFDFKEDAAAGDFSSHAIEINAAYSVDAFSIAGNFIVNEASGAGSAGSDMYFEAGYSFSVADVFLGAGDGWHSSDGDFALVNIGATASKEIEITDTFSLPLFGSVILNPDSEQFYILAGVSF